MATPERSRGWRRFVPAAGICLALVACSAGSACSGGSRAPAQGGGRLALEVPPLRLVGLDKACYDLQVFNGDGELIWQKGDLGTVSPTDTGTICSDVFGNGPGGDIAYVGPCDAARPVSDVVVYVDSLWADGAALAGGDWVNPCPSPNGCTQTFTCVENTDVTVVFNLTVMRNADQGFFDVGINFEDVFCSAKLDCTYDQAGTQPINLLFDPQTNERAQTAVLAVACTGGPGNTNTNTTLHLTEARFQCGTPAFIVAVPTTCYGDDGNETVYGLNAGMSITGSQVLSGGVWQKSGGVITQHAFIEDLDTLTYNGTTWSNAALHAPLPTNTDPETGAEYALGLMVGANATQPLGSVSPALYTRPAAPADWTLAHVFTNPTNPATGNPFPVVYPTVADPTTLDLWAVNTFQDGGDTLNARFIVFPYVGSTAPGSYTGTAGSYGPGLLLPQPADTVGSQLWLPTGGVRPGMVIHDNGLAGPQTYEYHIWRIATDGGTHIVLDNDDGTGLPFGSYLTDFHHFRPLSPDGFDQDAFAVVALDALPSVTATIKYETAASAPRARTLVFTRDGGSGLWVAEPPTFSSGAVATTTTFDHVMTSSTSRVLAVGTVVLDPGGASSAVFAFNETGNAWDYWNTVHIGGSDFAASFRWLGFDDLVAGVYTNAGTERLFVGVIPADNGGGGTDHTLDAVELPLPGGVTFDMLQLEGHFRRDLGKLVFTQRADLHPPTPADPGYVDTLIAWKLDPAAALASIVDAYATIDITTYLNPTYVPSLLPGEDLQLFDIEDSLVHQGGWSQAADARWDAFAPRCPAILTSTVSFVMDNQINRGFVIDVDAMTGGHLPSDVDEIAPRPDLVDLFSDATRQVLDLNKPKGNVWSASNPDPAPADPLWQYALTYGAESLMCAGSACMKRYFTVSFGFDPGASNCWLHFDATATGSETVFGNNTTPDNTAYPIIRMGVQLTDVAGGLACAQNPLGAVDSGVQADYTAFDEVQHFCFAYSGGAEVTDFCAGVDDSYGYDTFGGTFGP